MENAEKLLIGLAQQEIAKSIRRRGKLASKVLTCPKCGHTKIFVYETIEAISQHFVDNGVWKHKYDNNEYGDGLYIDCRCDNCDHRWRSRRGLNFNNYYLSEED